MASSWPRFRQGGGGARQRCMVDDNLAVALIQNGRGGSVGAEACGGGREGSTMLWGGAMVAGPYDLVVIHCQHLPSVVGQNGVTSSTCVRWM